MAKAESDACVGRPPAGVHDDLGWALATVLRSYLQAAELSVGAMPGGVRGYRLLASVARDCPRSQLALAHHVGLDRTVVTYLLDELAAAGLIERRPDPDDRRTRRVVVTTAGKRRLAALERALAKVESRVLAGLTAGEADVLRGLLQRVAVRNAEDADSALTCDRIEELAAPG